MSDYGSPVFIGGVNRSGTSLIRQIIGSAEEIAIPPTEFGFFDFWQSLDISDEELTSNQFKNLVRQILKREKVQDWDLSRETVLGRTGLYDNSKKGLFTLFLNSYRKKESAARWGEKTTHSEKHFGELKEWYESLRFVQMIRHPLDTFASQKYYAEKNET